MTFTFSFTSTHRDLFDAIDAERTARMRMRWWARAGFGALGLMWLSGAAAAIAGVFRSVSPWQLLAWVVFGSWFSWVYIAAPMSLRRRVAKSTAAAQPLVLAFSDEGIECDVKNVGRFRREWRDLSGALDAKKGVLFGFTDGSFHWIPNRAFAAPSQRAAFVQWLFEKRTFVLFSGAGIARRSSG